MADKMITGGGDPVTSVANADQVTIGGNGTRRHPLYVIPGAGSVVVHDDSLRGDGTIASPLGTDPTIPLVNGDSVPLVPGMPVAPDFDLPSTVRRATASSQSLAAVVGLVIVGAEVTLPARVKAIGVVHLTTLQWDVVTGAAGGLIPGASYFLSPSAGHLTTTPPSTPGLSLNRIGYAIDRERMAIFPSEPVLL